MPNQIPKQGVDAAVSIWSGDYPFGRDDDFFPEAVQVATLEIDHIVSLELGGSNDIANRFPEKL
jgi:hypothetical protein